MSFPSFTRLSEEQIFSTYTTERVPVGVAGMTEDGRVFRFCENGGVAQLVARFYQSEVPSANGLNEVVATMAAGATVITGVGATTADIAIDALKEGYVFSLTAADTNPAYRIKSNTLLDAGAATGTITLYSPLQAAIAAASTISYFKNPYRDVVVAVATTPDAFVCGVAVQAIALDEFGWLQTRGPARVLAGGTTYVIGDPVGPGGVAGSAIPIAATELTVPLYGHVIVAATNAEMGMIFVQID